MAIPVESVPLVMDPPGRWSALARLAVGMVLAMTTWFSASAVADSAQFSAIVTEFADLRDVGTALPLSSPRASRSPW